MFDGSIISRIHVLFRIKSYGTDEGILHTKSNTETSGDFALRPDFNLSKLKVKLNPVSMPVHALTITPYTGTANSKQYSETLSETLENSDNHDWIYLPKLLKGFPLTF